MKKTLSLILALVLLVGLVPTNVFAANTESDMKNPFAGKTVSILSASTSTYDGVSNNASANSMIGKNAVYYTEGRYGVYLKDTWWQQVIDVLDMELLVNNSWSGSCVFRPRKGAASVGYGNRAVNLHNDHTGEEPDIIWVYLGSNDFAYYKDTFGKAEDVNYADLIRYNGDGTFTYAAPQTTCEAYAIMLHKIQARYPDAEVYCMTVLARRDPDYAADSYADVGQPAAYNAEIIQVAERMGCTVINWENCIPKEAVVFDTYIGDKRAHPNASGMDLMSQSVISAMLGRGVEMYDVSGTYSGVYTDNFAAAAIDGIAYHANLSADEGYYDLEVNVTMGGVDITKSACTNGTIHIETVTGDIKITAAAYRTPQEFRWEVADGHLASSGKDENALTVCAETIRDSMIVEGQYRFATPVILKHDRPWVVEWKCAEDWRGNLLSSHLSTSTNGRTYLARTKGGQLCFGVRSGGQSNNYGVDLPGLDGQSHTYRLENRIASDGSNMVWLYLDGAEIGPMNNYFIASKDQHTTSDWISGKDFEFSYIGTDTTPVTNCKLDYFAIWESNLAITEQPADAAAKLNQTACSTVVAQGEGLTYQWYYRDAGQKKFTKSTYTGDTYSLIMYQRRNNREIYCVITDAYGNQVTSDTATLRIEEKLEIITQPKNAAAKLNQTACSTVVAQGEGLTYQWYYRDAGQKKFTKSTYTGDTYSLIMYQRRNNREIYCVITDAYGNQVTSDTAILRITPEENLHFDDHVDMTGKTVEIIDAGTPTSYQVGYGIEENAVPDTAVVTMEGDVLVATGIGTAVIKVDGQEIQVNVTAAPISLLLLIGQSNMQGSEGDENQSIVCPDGMVYSTYGDRYTMTTANATNFAPSALTGAGSAVNVNGTTESLEEWPVYLLNAEGVGKKGPDSGFAYEWVKQTGEKVWIVNAAHGGSTISTWQDGGANYEECVLLFKACMATLQKEIDAGHFTLSHMGYFWCQGCGDYSKTAQWYVNKYLAMHNNLKTELAFDADTTFEFAGIIPVRAGHESYTSYRQGVYEDTTSKKYHESFKDLRFTGPRVAQYWMTNNPDLPDIWNVCNIGEDWVWMPDGTNGVSAYFQSHYPNGTVDYTTQVQQTASWYTPTTPAAVHDSIHYNQIGYNEVGREAARNALIMLGEIEAPDVETSVKLLSWDGYTEVTEIQAAAAGYSGTLVVPKVYPVWESKNVTYAVSDGLAYTYYDLLADSPLTDGTLSMAGMDITVSVLGRELGSYSWELENGTLVSTGATENTITRVSGTTENDVFLDTQYRLDDPFILLHDQNWALEWKMTGPWYDADSTTSKKLFCQDGASATADAMCLMVNGVKDRITIGYFGASTHISYGLNLGDYGITVTDTHIYRLVNHIHDDGTNTIYLFVDGKQIGPMTQYFTGSGGDMGKQSDYLSGKDLYFGYLGTPKYLLDNGTIEYIAVAESGASSDIHFHDWSDWETIREPNKNGPGEKIRACAGCAETERCAINSIWQTTTILQHWNELPETVCGGLNLWSVLEHDPQYYVNSKGDWDYHSSKAVPSVTFAVQPGDRIYATSFGAAKSNGSKSSNGIRVTFFDINGVVKTMDPAGTYGEFTQNGGYLIVPEGAIAVNIPMWNNEDSNEIYILNRDHSYKNGVCVGCGDVRPGPIIICQPADAAAKLNQKAYSTVVVQGEDLTYQWYYRDAGQKKFNKSEYTGDTYSLIMYERRNNREIYCVITDAYGNTVTTKTVTLTISE